MHATLTLDLMNFHRTREGCLKKDGFLKLKIGGGSMFGARRGIKAGLRIGGFREYKLSPKR